MATRLCFGCCPAKGRQSLKATTHSADKVAGDAAGSSNFTDDFVAKDREGCLRLASSLIGPTEQPPPPWGESRLEGPAASDKEALLEPFQPPPFLSNCLLVHLYAVDTVV